VIGWAAILSEHLIKVEFVLGCEFFEGRGAGALITFCKDDADPHTRGSSDPFGAVREGVA
jgi:hypothetical protein